VTKRFPPPIFDGRALPGGALLLSLILLLSSGVAGAVDVIANRSVSLNTLSLASARAIFGMRQVKWPDGTPIRVFVLPDEHPTHGGVCKERLNLFPYQLRQSWDRLVYSGMAQAPSEVASEEELMNRVAATPGAIGYVRKVKANDPVKILNIE
jgi:ABC-type phosphate transport system substrate-binding protein